MKKNGKWFIISTILLSGVLFFASSAKNIVNAQGNGIKSAIPAYYDHKLYTIIFVEFSSKAEETLIAHNPGINFIYQYDPGLDGQPFISVIDAIPGDGMNPIWEEIQIQFNTIPPQQFYRDDEILAAASSGAITLLPTGEVYKCPVIGKKPK
jgi:hypothetical protein